MAAAGAASLVGAASGATTPANLYRTTKREQYMDGLGIFGGQPHRGTAGMSYGTKTRGNRAVQRAATKKRNQARHRAACR